MVGCLLQNSRSGHICVQQKYLYSTTAFLFNFKELHLFNFKEQTIFIHPQECWIVWEMSAEIPYWWRVTTQIWVVLLIARDAWEFDLTNQKHYPDLGSDESSVWNFCPRFSDVIWYGVPSPPKLKVDHNIQLESVTFDSTKINIQLCSSIL